MAKTSKIGFTNGVQQVTTAGGNVLILDEFDQRIVD
jgi:hypothetical protein